jgi:hypothetical protein
MAAPGDFLTSVTQEAAVIVLTLQLLLWERRQRQASGGVHCPRKNKINAGKKNKDNRQIVRIWMRYLKRQEGMANILHCVGDNRGGE